MLLSIPPPPPPGAPPPSFPGVPFMFAKGLDCVSIPNVNDDEPLGILKDEDCWLAGGKDIDGLAPLPPKVKVDDGGLKE